MKTCTPIPFKINVISCLFKTQTVEDSGTYEFDRIINIVCQSFKVTESALRSKLKTRDIIDARYIAMYFIKNKLGRISNQKIGDYFNRDHSTVTWSLQRTEDYILTDSDFKKKFELIKRKLR